MGCTKIRKNLDFIEKVKNHLGDTYTISEMAKHCGYTNIKVTGITNYLSHNGAIRCIGRNEKGRKIYKISSLYM